MDEKSTILTEIHEKVGLVRFNRPKALNALNARMLKEIMDALYSFEADKNIGAMVITGNNRAFAAGADISDMKSASAVEMLVNDWIAQFDRIRELTKPVIAAVSGYCLGGGNELAMSCDLIIASETAKFGQPEINLGVIPGAGGTQRLTRAVGKAIALEMVLNARTLKAEEALQFGLINAVKPLESYLEDALELAGEIAGRAPMAIRMAKEAVNQSFETSLTEGLANERRAFYFLFSTNDQKEGMRAFLEKREPEWQGQ